MRGPKDTDARPPSIVVTDTDPNEVPSEASASRPSSRPKLVHYLSGLHTRENVKYVDPEDDWWNKIEPLKKELPVDPLVPLQATFQYMREVPSFPIPVSHFSGIFRVFEDYRRIRDENEMLNAKLEESSRMQRDAKKDWAETETRYQLEIQRLQWLVADRTSGMTELAHVCTRVSCTC